MKTITIDQRELIDALLAEKDVGGLSAAILEKDIHVTDALRAMSAIAHDHVQLVFCGGTSLSKAYGVIERMSEDIDLKIVLSPSHGLSDNALRKHLSTLKEKIAAALTALDFQEITDAARARNANRYFASSWTYSSVYGPHQSLRTHLSIEFTVRTPAFDTSRHQLGYLVDRLAERAGEPFAMQCVAVEETLAEKVLSFLRRFAEHRAKVRKEWDETLVRHIYDTSRVVNVDPGATDRAAAHFRNLVEFDRTEFPRHRAFADDPAACMKTALNEIESDIQTSREYADRLIPLVYGQDKPTFTEAFGVFRGVASKLLGTL
ncbi:nucleotidyl transferase AbiEii/AbiGii toxin family protein (plasmid) [Robbsia andropogonis]|uniref:nucleotidyl transferase AbiEii/AbiGii toxin family protein n=1 Tax=Robbsia andropogonis TaxID=28092 RepID=UPI002A6A26FE|nr:nucleotidyl transferase AbiEii/AbiGii toxin family protein [Robbsia andropogonis]